MGIASNRIHIICGLCGCNNMFKYKISEEPVYDNDNIRDGNLKVFVLCENCGSLTCLDEVMSERRYPSGPKFITKVESTQVGTDKKIESEYWMVCFDVASDMYAYQVLSKNHNTFFTYCFYEYMGTIEDMSDELANRFAEYMPAYHCYKNYAGLMSEAYDCQTAKESLSSLADKKYCLIYRIVLDTDEE